MRAGPTAHGARVLATHTLPNMQLDVIAPGSRILVNGVRTNRTHLVVQQILPGTARTTGDSVSTVSTAGQHGEEGGGGGGVATADLNGTNTAATVASLSLTPAAAAIASSPNAWTQDPQAVVTEMTTLFMITAICDQAPAITVDVSCCGAASSSVATCTA